jgi:hypothetical protein
MARIAGVNLPTQKRLEIGLTYIFGIGQATARKVCVDLELSPDEKVRDLTDEEITKLRTYIDSNLQVEGDLRRERDRHLPRNSPPPGPPRARPADEDQRTDAQGAEEDRRPREESQVKRSKALRTFERGRPDVRTRR